MLVILILSECVEIERKLRLMMRTCINLVVFLCSELFKFDFAAEFTLNMKQSGVWGYIVC